LNDRVFGILSHLGAETCGNTVFQTVRFNDIHGRMLLSLKMLFEVLNI
jgi:hypothetical protein